MPYGMREPEHSAKQQAANVKCIVSAVLQSMKGTSIPSRHVENLSRSVAIINCRSRLPESSQESFVDSRGVILLSELRL